jgi:hypothetical protein
MTSGQASEYHSNTFKSIRSAINRHLHDIGRQFDIVRDREFKTCNNILDGKLKKKNLQEGLSRPTKHKDVIPTQDLNKISAYLYGDMTPVSLRFRVWFIIAIQFVSRGLEFHEQLKVDSFEFQFDENGHEYAVLSHETKQKNWQGGIDASETPKEKRMYAVPSALEKCPVKSLKQFLAKIDPTATYLFNRCSKVAMASPSTEEIWYTNVPIKKYQFTRFMADICKNAKCERTYTAHSLRATSIQGMNNAGFEVRHIMYMSGHRNESSVRSYSRECATHQRESMSRALTNLTVPQTEIDTTPQVTGSRKLNRHPKHQQKFRLLSSPPPSRPDSYQILLFITVSLISHPSK